LRKVLAEEEYHAVHAAAWVGRLADGPAATAARLAEVAGRFWPQCIAWFGPPEANGLDELRAAGVLADPAAAMRDRYVEAVRPMFAEVAVELAADPGVDWEGWSAARRRHGVPRFDETCFAMITGARTRAMGVRD
jgi:1,2-phenylacetyl-CoA epoxidase catalytic subunit